MRKLFDLLACMFSFLRISTNKRKWHVINGCKFCRSPLTNDDINFNCDICPECGEYIRVVTYNVKQFVVRKDTNGLLEYKEDQKNGC